MNTPFIKSEPGDETPTVPPVENVPGHLLEELRRLRLKRAKEPRKPENPGPGPATSSICEERIRAAQRLAAARVKSLLHQARSEEDLSTFRAERNYRIGQKLVSLLNLRSVSDLDVESLLRGIEDGLEIQQKLLRGRETPR